MGFMLLKPMLSPLLASLLFTRWKSICLRSGNAYGVVVRMFFCVRRSRAFGLRLWIGEIYGVKCNLATAGKVL